MSALRLRQDSQSGTPPAKRNATFSPRIIFYDTWPSQEYDRRGEIATCNRLTPLLAQQIKEELNSFKMVCSDMISDALMTDSRANEMDRRWRYTKTPRFTRTFSDDTNIQSTGKHFCSLVIFRRWDSRGPSQLFSFHIYNCRRSGTA